MGCARAPWFSPGSWRNWPPRWSPPCRWSFFITWPGVWPIANRAILVTLAYAFATETWTISSQALWQHGGSELAVIAALLFLMRAWERPQNSGALLLSGLLAALAVAVRPTNILFLGAVLIWLLASRCTAGRLALFLAAPAVIGAAMLAYNLRVFGQIAGGYAMDFDGAFWPGLAGLLASPGRGLLCLHSHRLVFDSGRRGLASTGPAARPPVYLVSILFSVSMILLVSKWRVWWGGHCYGPRLLTDIVPCLVLLLLPALQWMSAKPLLRACFGVALAASAFLQMVGAFCYPNSRWDENSRGGRRSPGPPMGLERRPRGARPRRRSAPGT